MKKEISIYSILLMIVAIISFSISIGFFIVNMKNKGQTEFESNYYDVQILNATIDYETKTSVKINDEDKVISIDIPDLYKYKSTNSFNVDLINIGTLDAKVDNIAINDIDTNVDKDLVDIKLSLKKNEKILGGEKKKLQITITYLGESEIEDLHYSCNIGFLFKEIAK